MISDIVNWLQQKWFFQVYLWCLTMSKNANTIFVIIGVSILKVFVKCHWPDEKFSVAQITIEEAEKENFRSLGQDKNASLGAVVHTYLPSSFFAILKLNYCSLTALNFLSNSFHLVLFRSYKIYSGPVLSLGYPWVK
jgi:hypothetical protein